MADTVAKKLSNEEKEAILAVVESFRDILNALNFDSRDQITAMRNVVNIQRMYMHALTSRRRWSCVEESTFWEKDVPKFPDKKFKDCFRVERTTFYSIVENMSLLEKKNTNWRKSIPINKRVAMSLYALGSNVEYRTVAGLFGVGNSTLSQIVIDFCRTIIQVYGNCFNDFYPATQEKIEENVKGFLKLGFPQCYGVIDAFHVKVKPTKSEAIDYLNYKGIYSSILFAAVDHHNHFMYINVGNPGKCSDYIIWDESLLKKEHMENELFRNNSKNFDGINVPVLLIGDAAFKLSQYVIKPYSFSIDQPKSERIFNDRISKCRQVVGNAYRHLRARFKRLNRSMDHKLTNINIIIKACCILHNIFIDRNDHINENWIEGKLKDTSRKKQRRIIRSRNSSFEIGSKIRNAIKNVLAAEEGNEDIGDLREADDVGELIKTESSDGVGKVIEMELDGCTEGTDAEFDCPVDTDINRLLAVVVEDQFCE